MSNPGVISLVRIDNRGYRFEIEDNIGECIHIHYGNIRLDMTISEFESLCDDVEKILDKMYGRNGFTCSDYDAQFLFDFSDFLRDIDKIEDDSISLEKILVKNAYDTDKPYCRLKESVLYTQILENRIDEYPINLFSKGENRKITNSERISYINDSILNNRVDKQIVISQNDVILDGKYRAMLSLIQDGNNDVPIKRIVLKSETAPIDKENRIFNAHIHIFNQTNDNNDPIVMPTEKLIEGNPIKIPPDTNQIKIMITENDNCILYNLKIDSNVGELRCNPINGIKIDNAIFFVDKKPKFIIDIGEKIEWISVTTGLSIKSYEDLLDEMKEKISAKAESDNERVKKCEQRIDNLVNSFSWKITKPIRLVYRWLKK